MDDVIKEKLFLSFSYRVERSFVYTNLISRTTHHVVVRLPIRVRLKLLFLEVCCGVEMRSVFIFLYFCSLLRKTVSTYTKGDARAHTRTPHVYVNISIVHTFTKTPHQIG